MGWTGSHSQPFQVKDLAAGFIIILPSSPGIIYILYPAISCSIGSTLALDRPYIALETSDECCLEYGTATQLYLVPFIQQEEQVRVDCWKANLLSFKIGAHLCVPQVCVPLTQNRYQGSRLLSAVDPSQVPIVSQVTLPCDSQGSIDFSNYPFRVSLFFFLSGTILDSKSLCNSSAI